MRRSLRNAPISLACAAMLLAGCPETTDYAGDEAFPRDPHALLPQYGPSNGQIATGVATGIALEQPINFPHYTHAAELGMQCEFCHSEARRSIHAGVPHTQVCMNCHSQVKKDSPEIQKLTEYWTSGEPIPWQKVHDLPDYVYFSHKRHVKAGVNCTECHGQVALQGQGDVTSEDFEVMIREASLQMGWCLDCHSNHPSVDENYGDKAGIRRAELKDCWTCHK